jgi:SAM-dependent methyltransferase
MHPKMSEAQLTDVLAWDTVNWAVALDRWLGACGANLQDQVALEIGAHGGGVSLWLALRGARVVFSDLGGPKQQARDLHARYNVLDRVIYEDIDATRIPYENRFDIVALKSVVGGIGRDNNKPLQIQVFREIHKALKPGGRLLFAENLVGSPLHCFFRKWFVQWRRSWRYLTLAELDEFLAPFASFEYHTCGFLGTFGRSEPQRRLLGHLDRAMLDSLVPASWRYIAMGVATK